ncbi:hypothetical protein NKJ26_20090 [Mesorhizobium sp. M0152]|uniref:hypothetical protein n=1 Tax=Mesorhizobium sp. M0152 TaxID=2956898 RepID=UPI00333C514F
MIRGHHEAYIFWEEFERNQQLIADNANGKSYLGRGAIRRGEALLPGLFRCERRLHVAYSSKGGNTQRYVCRGTLGDKAVDNCIRFSGMRVDRAVAQEVLGQLQPLGIEAALAAMEAQGQEHSDKRQQVENACRQARYEVERARRQYDAVDPENRLVAGELERRWNEKLTHLGELEEELDGVAALQAPTVSAGDRARLMALGKDLAQAWDSPGASTETRKKIIRLLVKEIIADVVDDSLAPIIHWQGGDHTRPHREEEQGRANPLDDRRQYWPARCQICRSPPSSIAPVKGQGKTMAGRVVGCFSATPMALRHTATANVRSVAKLRSTKPPRFSKSARQLSAA